MKRTVNLFIILGLFILSSCTINNSKKKATIQNSKIDSIEKIQGESNETIETNSIVLAKEWTDLMFEYIEKTEKEEITKTQLDELAKPLKLKQDSLKELLTPSQNKELEVYFQKKGNEMVDRLMELNKFK